MSGQGSYLITGGTGALGLALAGWLVGQGAGHLVLLSRRGATTPEARDAVAALEGAGARLVVVKADVADRAALYQALDQALADLPPLRGVIHAAGVLDDGMLIGQTWPRFEKVMAAKVEGAWHLHQYTAQRDLDFFALFSSVAAVLGNQGQGNYASANAFLDALAHYRQQRGLPAISINWGPWEQAVGMVDAQAEERLARQGFKGIETAAGLDALTRLLASGQAAQVVVAPCDWRVYLGQTPAAQAFLAPLIAGPIAREPELSRVLGQASPLQQRALLRDFVVETARRIIGLDPADTLDVDRPLMEIGMDSLMSVEMRNCLGRGLGRSLPVGLLFNYPSVREVLGYLEREMVEPDGVAAPEERREEADVRFAHLDELSEQELEDLIEQELTGE